MATRRRYPDSSYVKPKRAPLVRTTPGNGAVRAVERGHEHRTTKQVLNSTGQDGRETRAPERSAATVRATSSATPLREPATARLEAAEERRARSRKLTHGQRALAASVYEDARRAEVARRAGAPPTQRKIDEATAVAMLNPSTPREYVK